MLDSHSVVSSWFLCLDFICLFGDGTEKGDESASKLSVFGMNLAWAKVVGQGLCLGDNRLRLVSEAGRVVFLIYKG